jgi:hypothetical protein
MGRVAAIVICRPKVARGRCTALLCGPGCTMPWRDFVDQNWLYIAAACVMVVAIGYAAFQ